MTARAVLYARVSSDDTRNEGRNLRSQIDMCREHALKRGWVVVAELSEDDRGASGASLDLPQLNRMLDMARAREFDVVVVRELDRFSRTLAKQLIVEEELRRYGVRIEYTLGEYPDTPEGSLMKNVKASVAEYERLKINERMKRGIRQIVKSGTVMLHGDRPPYGYRVSEDGKTLVIHDQEAQTVRMIFDWYVMGDEVGKKLSNHHIAKRLSALGIPTWVDVHGHLRKTMGYGQWHPGSIKNIVTSETYIGRWHYGRKSNKGRNPPAQWLTIEVPRIVEDDVWEKAQAQRRRNKETSSRNAKYGYLMRSRLTCGRCGSAMHGKSALNRQKARYLYYHCRAAAGGILKAPKCNMPAFRSDQVDPVVWEWVRSFLRDPEKVQRGLRSHQAEQAEGWRPLRERLAVVEQLIAENSRQLDRLIDLYLSGDFPKDMLLERRNRLETTLEGLEQEYESLRSPLDVQILTEDQIVSLQEFVSQVAVGLEAADTDFELRRQVIEKLDVRATLAIEDGERVVHARCMVGKKLLSIAATTSPNSPSQTSPARIPGAQRP